MICDMHPPAYVIDADTIVCANGVHIRIAGIEANERGGGCHISACSPMGYAQARTVAQRLVMGHTLSCEPLGRSYKRIVARCSFQDGRDLRCVILASGAAVEWPMYVKRYGLEPCR